MKKLFESLSSFLLERRTEANSLDSEARVYLEFMELKVRVQLDLLSSTNWTQRRKNGPKQLGTSGESQSCSHQTEWNNRIQLELKGHLNLCGIHAN